MLLFGFEADTLEIALREQADLVDRVYIVESTVSHQGLEKPLAWERLRHSNRFGWLPAGRVRGLVVDDQLRTKDAREEQWRAEERQTDLALEKVRRLESLLSGDDILVSGSVDEVLGREALRWLRVCALAAPVISGALWMPLGDLGRAFRSDYPVPGRAHTFAQPTIYRWDAVMAAPAPAGRRLFTSLAGFVPGGVHLTAPAFLPTALLKELTATEENIYPGTINLPRLMALGRDGLDAEQARLYRLEDKECMRARADPVDRVVDVAREVPWALACAPDRFPYWYGRPDPRNGLLAQLLARDEALHSQAGRWRRRPSDRLFGMTFLAMPEAKRNSSGGLLACVVVQNF
jgi:hypothetical protein